MTTSEQDTPDTSIAADDFGGNEWIVEDMYRRYLDAPGSVSEAWREYFDGSGRQDAVPEATEQMATATPLRVVPSPPEAEPEPEPRPEAEVAPEPQPEPPAEEAPAEEPEARDDADLVEMRGAPATIAQRMEESKELPTATSVRTLPAKLLEVNRRIVNNQLARRDGGRISFTHIIGWAVVKALLERPALNAAYQEIEGKPHRVQYRHINLGLAIDVERKDGSRTLLVPSIKAADEMDFHAYWVAYEDIVRRVRKGEITPDDFAGTTATITNPGTVGTVQSVPRLMTGQGVIVGVGAIQYPPEYEGSDPVTLAAQGVGRTLTVTSTYDHRIIQGAESGLFLQRMDELLLGADRFYEEIFESMEIPYVPARWAVDHNPPPGSREWAEKQARVFQLINNHRVRGHLIADLDPLRQRAPMIHPELDPLTYGLTIWDLDREFATGGLAGTARTNLGRILGLLRDAYCRSVGIEYMHIQEPDQKLWIQEHVEGGYRSLPMEEKRRLLQKLNEAEAFERFLHTKFLGAKRFSLEGSESMIPLIDGILNEAADTGMEKAFIGMAHRGRLNVLANVVGKDMKAIFREFEGGGGDDPNHFSGDVKYHLGGRGRHKAPSGATIDLEIVANPSHLEAVDPVLEGIVRAHQDQTGEGAIDLILPLLIHGDAAFAGQGVVAETFNLSQLPSYHTGGTIHVVVNNQVGFTTTVVDARSSQYATDVAKIVQAPIFHVNGDDPEAVARVARLAFHFREAFHKDVVIDLTVYRRLGHNEGDEPTYTQPRMYKLIAEHPSVRRIYMERLINSGEMTPEEGEAVLESFKQLLDEAYEAAKGDPEPLPAPPAEPAEPPQTRIDREVADHIEEALRRFPEGFTPHPKLARIVDERAKNYRENRFDWGMAEAFAFGSLAMEGIDIRLVGEDSQRGTFSHRHAVLVDYETEEEYAPLSHVTEDQARVQIADSMLSEFAALGFEYGYSIGDPDALVIWEAQFGDFINGAQVVIDQFLMTGYDKWQQTTGLTMLLPHGFEGQGPEHSSARIERFLQNAADDNVRLVVPTTTGQHFHLFRRQALWEKRRPLIVMSPKSLLRTRETYSPIDVLTQGRFQPVIADTTVSAGARRVLLCAGKIYYDLARHREENDIDDVAIIRVEELFPFPAEDIKAAVASHGEAEVCWVQEEPANMGAWRFMSRFLFVEAGIASRGIYRTESASPATGSSRIHAREQAELVTQAFQP